MAELYSFVTRDAATIRGAILRVLRSALIRRGVTNPNVTPGSDYYVFAQAVANQLEVTEANGVVKADEAMPDTATGEALDARARTFGLARQAASGSVGSVILVSSASTTIATGSQLIDENGLAYEVTTGGIYANEQPVPIRAIDTGTQTNHEAGDILRWVSTPLYSDEKAEVNIGGLVNGVDEEDDESFRERFRSRLQNPPASGNAQHFADWGEASTPSVQKSFVNPAIQGAGSVHVAVTAAPTSSNKSRDVATATLNGTVRPYVAGQAPEHVEVTTTTVENVDADVAFGLTLPEATTASPPGSGGGWLDGSPWPAPDASTTWRCTVTAVTSTTVFTVDATTSPTIGVSQICWLSPYDWQLYRATVTAVSGTSGAYTITIDQAFVDIAIGCYIWPAAQNASLYVAAALASFALMGPGEKTTNASALVRGFRRPRPAQGWPATLGAHLLRAITSAQTEVDDATFFHRTDGTVTVTDAAGVVTPQVPAALTDAPKIYRPRHLAFYRIP